jgi:hypothetical protein
MCPPPDRRAADESGLGCKADRADYGGTYAGKQRKRTPKTLSGDEISISDAAMLRYRSARDNPD